MKSKDAALHHLIRKFVRIARMIGCDVFIYLRRKGSDSALSCSTGDIEFHDRVSEALDQQDCAVMEQMMDEAEHDLSAAINELNREWRERQ